MICLTKLEGLRFMSLLFSTRQELETINNFTVS